jgi:hypothetical protein
MVGHIKLDRKILSWEWYQDANTCRLFIHLLLIANHKETRWKGIPVLRGQVITGLDKLCTQIGLSIQQARTAFDKLQTTGELTIKVTNKYRLVTICKYDYYQSYMKEDNKQDNNKITNNSTSQQQSDNKQVTANNNDNNIKEDKEVNNSYKGQFPKFSDFNGLPEIKIGAAQQLIKITQKVDLTEIEIIDMWEIFKTQYLTGEKFYQDKGAVYEHFTNWIKSQKFNNGTGTNKTGVGGTKPSRIEALKKW